MIAFAFLLAVTAAALLGYHYRQLKDTVEALKSTREERKKPTKEVSKGVLLDPDDVVQRAKWEHEERMRKLNND